MREFRYLKPKSLFVSLDLSKMCSIDITILYPMTIDWQNNKRAIFKRILK